MSSVIHARVVCRSDLSGETRIVGSLFEILDPLRFEEVDRPTNLVESVDAVFNGDPAAESRLRQEAEDRTVIVQSATDFAVLQRSGVASCAVCLSQVGERRSASQIAIGRVHRDDAVANFMEERDWVVPADQGVGGIVLNTEKRR